MPPEILHGVEIPALLAHARALLGEEARMLSLRAVATGGFELRAQAASDGPEIQAMRPLPPLGGRLLKREPRVFALVGPTGSGKTTTLAKLANHPDVFVGDAVGLLCLDTYRVGAIEQARAYAELSRLPLEVVYEPGDLPRARRRLRDCEVLLVDTAGRAPGRPDDLAEMRALLRELAPLEVHLTLPAGLDRERARQVLAQHRPLGVTHVLATKVDEFPRDTVVAALAAAAELPMRWRTTGQEVPADLAWAGVPAAAEVA